MALNTAAIANPELITAISKRFGNQAVVISIEAKAKPDGSWEAYVDIVGKNWHRRCGLGEAG